MYANMIKSGSRMWGSTEKSRGNRVESQTIRAFMSNLHLYFFQDMMDQCAMRINVDQCAIKF